MFQGYYNLASNLIVQNRNMNVISNNMTNISTPGFKSDQLVQGTFRDEILYRFERDGRTPIGTTSRINTAEGVATDQTQGTLRATERALDLALSGKGFFAVQSGQETVYTRNGSFNVDNEGYLVLQGLGRVQGQNGPIRVNTDDIRVTEQGYVLSADGRENYGRLQVVDFADVVFLAVKPQFLEGVLDEIKDSVKEGQIFISIAPGKTLQWLGGHLGMHTKVIRTMPNTPAMVGEGMTALCVNELVTEKETELAVKLCDTFGKTEVIPEHLMDAVVGVSGSSPAYVFMFLEAMADAAVADGMPRAQAYKFAAQSVLGSAKLMLETGKHPGELKDMVCSPAGTTIQAVRVLEEKGLRSAVIEAQTACVKKAKGM